MMWAIKIAAKIVLSRLPVPYGFWKKVGLFRHGRMDAAAYTLKIFNMHIERAYPQGVPPNAVFLELGPGDSVASCLLASGLGVARIYLVDVGCYARQDVNFYQRMAADLQASGAKVTDLSSASSFSDILHACNATYLTSGLRSLEDIASNSVDFIWSHSVLEHVRKNDIQETIHEMKRILKPGGYASHNIDFQDHLDGSLNNLRFPERIWESRLFANSGFYTNRIPAVRLHALFREAGFNVLKEEFGQWSMLPVARESLHPDFQVYQDADLINRTSHLLLQA